MAVLVFATMATARTGSGEGCPAPLGGWPYYPVSTAALEGATVYLGSGPGLIALDVSAPEAPRVVGGATLSRYFRGIAAGNGHAFLAYAEPALGILDVSKPSRMREVGTYDLPAPALSVTLDEDLLYVTADGLRIVDVHDPVSPVEVGHCAECEGRDAAIDGGYAYLPGNYGLRVVDVSDPSRPSLVGAYGVAATCFAVAVRDGYAYVACETAGLRVVDVGDPSAPREVGSAAHPGWVVDVALSGSVALLVDSYSSLGLRLVDVSTPTRPVEMARVEMPAYQYAQAVAAVGNVAYVADSGGLLVVDVSNPVSPEVVARHETVMSVLNIAVAGRFAFVTGHWQDGLHVIDLSLPEHPLEVAALPGAWDNREVGIAVRGSLAFLAGPFGLKVMDVSDAVNPVEVGSYQTPATAKDIAVDGDLAYIVEMDEMEPPWAFRVFDVSDPSRPFELGSCDASAGAVEVAVADHHAYLAGPGGLRIIDVSNPNAPVEVGSHEAWGNTLAVAGRLVFVGGGYDDWDWGPRGWVYAIDVSTPSRPVEVGRLESTSWVARDIAVAGRFALVASMGVIVLDVSAPASMREVAHYSTVAYTEGLSLEGARAYLGGGKGFEVLDLSCVLPYAGAFEGGEPRLAARARAPARGRSLTAACRRTLSGWSRRSRPPAPRGCATC